MLHVAVSLPGVDTMPSSTDPRLLAPRSFPVAAYKAEETIRDHNNSEKTKEELWLDAARAQDAEVSSSEVDFFQQLRTRTGA
jgi:hypothetical protein